MTRCPSIATTSAARAAGSRRTGRACRISSDSTNRLKWTSTLLSKLLIEAGFSKNYLGYNLQYQGDVARPSAANPFGDVSKSDSAIGAKTSYNAAPTEFYNPFVANQMIGLASYVTGSHSIKVGVQHKFGWIKNTMTQNGNMVQVYNNGVPLQVRAYNTPMHVARRPQRRHRPLHPGRLANPSPDAQSRPPLRTVQRRSRSRRTARPAGSFGARAFRRDQEPARLQELGAAASAPPTTCSATARPA